MSEIVLKCLLYLLCLLLIFLYVYYAAEVSAIGKTSDIANTTKATKAKTSIKFILFWSPFWTSTTYGWGTGLKLFQKCKFKNCFATDNRLLVRLDEFDALIFHATYRPKKHGTPTVRSPHQRYIFMNLEPPLPHIYPALLNHSSFFNWTYSYRDDGDLVVKQGSVIKKRKSYKLPSVKFVQKKRRLVAWFVSNCETPSLREHLASALGKLVQVDVFGKCGNLTCPKAKGEWVSSKACYAKIEKQYKFYLSFENSYCKDYTTEKLWNILDRDLVPIVYGGDDYKKISPPHSVINVGDYKTIEDLARYLQYLDAHPKEYVKYFKWKKSYSVVWDDTVPCQLCEKLNQDTKPKVYENIFEWWSGSKGSVCKIDKQLPNIVSSLNVSNNYSDFDMG